MASKYLGARARKKKIAEIQRHGENRAMCRIGW